MAEKMWEKKRSSYDSTNDSQSGSQQRLGKNWFSQTKNPFINNANVKILLVPVIRVIQGAINIIFTHRLATRESKPQPPVTTDSIASIKSLQEIHFHLETNVTLDVFDFKLTPLEISRLCLRENLAVEVPK